MSCELRHDLTIIRGDSKPIFVGLSGDWANISADPSLYQGRLVFRERQDDTLPELLVITSTVEDNDDVRFPGLPYILDFSMTPAQTAGLPDYPVVCFCEVRKLDASEVRRLFEGNVRQRD